MRLPTHAQLVAFCQYDHWRPKPQGDHIRFTKLINGKLHRTKISRGPGGIDDRTLFAHILRDQLAVDHDEFWRVVESGEAAHRPTPVQPVPQTEIPAWIVSGLRKEGVPSEQIKALTEDGAKALLLELRSRPRP